MRYQLTENGIMAEKGKESPCSSGCIVEVLKAEELEQAEKSLLHKASRRHNLKDPQYCKADMLKDCVLGTLVIPDKANLLDRSFDMGFYLDKERLIFVDDTGTVEKMIKESADILVSGQTYIVQFFIDVLEYLVHEDSIFLQEYEEKMSRLEGELLEDTVTDFNRRMLGIRKEILTLQSFYQQLADMSETLIENQNHMFEDEDIRVFHLYSRRVDRLFDHVQRLKEYSLQLREMYESQIGIRQNQIMKVLTVVTTIFMPLSLIAGWYGMNFVNMPELQSPGGYQAIIIVSIVIILIEIWLFKIKKWFD